MSLWLSLSISGNHLPENTRGEGTATAAALSEAMEHSELF